MESVEEEGYRDVDHVKVKNQCESEWKQLKSVQADLQTASPEPTRTINPDVAEGNEQLQILHAQEKRLKAELHVLRSGELKTLPESKDMQLLILQQDQAKQLEQLEETITFYRAKRSEVLEDIKQEEEANVQLQKVHDKLQSKVSSLEQWKSSVEEGSSVQCVLKDMSTNYETVTEMESTLKATLSKLISRHFPVSGEEARLDESRDIDMDNVLTLESIVEKLIKQTLNSPAQPYIEIDDKFWPQHIEFLHRCQIILKDPQNLQRIKLVPFHL